MDCSTNKKPVGAENQEISKELRVVSRPSGHGRYAPSIRVAGKWLSQFGFEMDDIVVLTAKQGEINIKRKDLSVQKRRVQTIGRKMDAQQWLEKGICAYKSKQYEVAIGYFDQTLRIDHNFADAYCWRGRVHFTLGIFAKAVADYTKAILAKPDDAESYYWRGVEQSVHGERNKAFVDFDKAIELDPTFAEACSQRAHLFVYKDNDAKALSDFTNSRRTKSG